MEDILYSCVHLKQTDMDRYSILDASGSWLYQNNGC
uniref:Uncharacterized protein n=1 Tax=Rhizophora mucronata TaxID=61149 RepID=A0A2P2NMD5_RHIMU